MDSPLLSTLALGGLELDNRIVLTPITRSRAGTERMANEFRTLYCGVLMGNCGYTQETAEAAIKNGQADLISFGRPYISNPDLVERFANGWPLAPDADMASWYSADLGAKGYTSFTAYEAILS